MSEFQWVAGCRLTKKIADPQVIGAELAQLHEANGGRLTARLVVDAARPIEAPLHPLFEWDDVRACSMSLICCIKPWNGLALNSGHLRRGMRNTKPSPRLCGTRASLSKVRRHDLA